jgi:uncharacterized protein (TIGR03067 family)
MMPMVEANRMARRASAAALTFLLVLATGAGFSLGAGAARSPAEDEKSSADVLKALQGTWVSANENVELKWTFEGETLKATVNGTDYTCKVKLDATAKPNATADFLIDEGPEDAKGKTSKAIYKLDGEKLIICVSHPGKDRPKQFESAEGEAYLFELKKEKKS